MGFFFINGCNAVATLCIVPKIFLELTQDALYSMPFPMEQMKHSRQNKQGGGQNQASEIQLVRFTMRLHISNSECL
jgi:hypothetical protein